MNCQHAFDRSFDDEAGAASPEAVEHVATCLRCRRVRRAFDRSRLLLRSLPTPPVSADFADRIQRRIARMEHDRRRRVHRLRVGLGWGSASAVAVVLVLLMQPGWPPLTPRSTAPPPAPAVRVVRPLASLPGRPAGGLFTALAAPDVLDEPEPELARAAAWNGTFAPAAEAASVHASTAPRRWPSLPGSLSPFSSPVVFAAPSWTFAAAPATFQFVSTAGPAAFSPLHP